MQSNRIPSRYALWRRQKSVSFSAPLARFYSFYAKVLIRLGRLCKPFIRLERLNTPLIWIEKPSKKLLFDCQMCGQCVLSSTGMSCPTNCPKSIRNGPCGGVRANGHCEVIPEMRCVWVEAWRGAQNMIENKNLSKRLKPIDHRLWGQSSWLPVITTEGDVDYGALPPPAPQKTSSGQT